MNAIARFIYTKPFFALALAAAAVTLGVTQMPKPAPKPPVSPWAPAAVIAAASADQDYAAPDTAGADSH